MGVGAGRLDATRRERLIRLLRRRHHLAAVIVDGPPGYGKSTLLDQALAEGAAPGSVDVKVALPPTATLAAAAAMILEALGSSSRMSDVSDCETARWRLS